MFRTIVAVMSVLSSATALAVERPPAYTVSVTLTDRAAARLSGAGESITVSSMYEVEPRPGEGDGMPIPVGEEQHQIDGAGTIEAGQASFDTAELAKGVAGKEPELLINVYTSRRKFEDNLLDCDIWQGPLSTIPRDRPIEIACKLIGE